MQKKEQKAQEVITEDTYVSMKKPWRSYEQQQEALQKALADAKAKGDKKEIYRLEREILIGGRA